MIDDASPHTPAMALVISCGHSPTGRRPFVDRADDHTQEKDPRENSIREKSAGAFPHLSPLAACETSNSPSRRLSHWDSSSDHPAMNGVGAQAPAHAGRLPNGAAAALHQQVLRVLAADGGLWRLAAQAGLASATSPGPCQRMMHPQRDLRRTAIDPEIPRRLRQLGAIDAVEMSATKRLHFVLLRRTVASRSTSGSGGRGATQEWKVAAQLLFVHANRRTCSTVRPSAGGRSCTSARWRQRLPHS